MLDENGKPIDKSYLECGLNKSIVNSIRQMEDSWKIIDNGGKDIHWDLNWCELMADINSAEADGEISKEQAQYLRRKYLRME